MNSLEKERTDVVIQKWVKEIKMQDELRAKQDTMHHSQHEVVGSFSAHGWTFNWIVSNSRRDRRHGVVPYIPIHLTAEQIALDEVSKARTKLIRQTEQRRNERTVKDHGRS